MAGYHIGIDIGGTFTDCFVTDGTRSWSAKAPTTPAALDRGLTDSLRQAAAAASLSLEALLRETVHFGLGTTSVTNVLAEQRGARTGLVTTRGFADLFTIARGHRLGQNGMSVPLPDLVPRERVAEVAERIDSNGRILLGLDAKAARRTIRRLVADERIEALAICLLWSCRNAAHEIALERIVRELDPRLFVTRSSEVFPVVREYERMTATVLNAYCWQSFSTFLGQIERGLSAAGLAVPIAIMQSSGGTCSAAEALRLPVHLAQSGPVAGVVGAQRIGGASGRRDLITADLGGTSYDVCLVRDGEPVTKARAEIAGLWTGLVTVDVSSIGAGGGSLAWIDSRGMLQVGPRSAGADPGPVCYARGGDTPTLTDALVLLGYIDPNHFLGGRMRLDAGAAAQAMRTLGGRLGLDGPTAAAGVYRIALENMTLATRGLLAEKGHDPREFALLSYGGAGSLFTAPIARELGVREVIVPRWASVFSAFGAAGADVRRDRARTVLAKLPFDPAGLERTFAELESEVRAQIRAQVDPRVPIEIVREGDLRFVRQNWGVTVALPGGRFDEAALGSL
ncbi:MAG TPA: hydantoinase/oxoprolinase family protein, partial [Candidatus Binatia bacterium]|nr:hydantoinase/oxoprolinase family protein [Candidatus Binatia bacterium]